MYLDDCKGEKGTEMIVSEKKTKKDKYKMRHNTKASRNDQWGQLHVLRRLYAIEMI